MNKSVWLKALLPRKGVNKEGFRAEFLIVQSRRDYNRTSTRNLTQIASSILLLFKNCTLFTYCSMSFGLHTIKNVNFSIQFIVNTKCAFIEISKSFSQRLFFHNCLKKCYKVLNFQKISNQSRQKLKPCKRRFSVENSKYQAQIIKPVSWSTANFSVSLPRMCTGTFSPVTRLVAGSEMIGVPIAVSSRITTWINQFLLRGHSRMYIYMYNKYFESNFEREQERKRESLNKEKQPDREKESQKERESVCVVWERKIG